MQELMDKIRRATLAIETSPDIYEKFEFSSLKFSKSAEGVYISEVNRINYGPSDQPFIIWECDDSWNPDYSVGDVVKFTVQKLTIWQEVLGFVMIQGKGFYETDGWFISDGSILDVRWCSR